MESKYYCAVDELVVKFHGIDEKNKLEQYFADQGISKVPFYDVAPLKYVVGDDRLHDAGAPNERLNFVEHTIKCRANIWTEGEIRGISEDRKEYEHMLSADEKIIFHGFTAVFSELDAIINESIESNLQDIASYDIKQQYIVEEFAELVHQKAYSKHLEGTITDPKIREDVRNSIKTYKSINRLVKWFRDNTKRDLFDKYSFSKRILIKTLVEGVVFAGAFACVYYFGYLGKMTSLFTTNKWIIKDENTHVETSFMIWDIINKDHKISDVEAVKIVEELVDIVKELNGEMCPVRLPELNSDLLNEYTQHMTNLITTRLGIGKLYTAENNLGFMPKINFDSITNNFETASAEYEQNIEEECDFDNLDQYEF